jgi:hypothetical protein
MLRPVKNAAPEPTAAIIAWACIPVYLPLPSGVTTPAAVCGGTKPRLMMFTKLSTLPKPLGNTSPSLPSTFGHVSFHSLSALAHDLAEGDSAVTGIRLRLTDLVEAISALAHVQLASLEIDILPSKPS